MERLIVGLLVLIVVIVLFKYSPSYFPSTSGGAPKAATSVQDVKTMISSGMPEINIIVNLIKSGVPAAEAEQLVMQAKKS
jgi:hypothetical protein